LTIFDGFRLEFAVNILSQKNGGQRWTISQLSRRMPDWIERANTMGIELVAALAASAPGVIVAASTLPRNRFRSTLGETR
jgi:hypothetical protein